MRWKYLNPQTLNPAVFGIKPVVVKVSKWLEGGDIRSFSLRGWVTYAELMDISPVTGKQLSYSEWFVFATK